MFPSGARLWDCRQWELYQQIAGDVEYVIKAFCVRVSKARREVAHQQQDGP